MKYAKVTAEQCKDGGLAIILILLLVSWFGDRPVYVGPAIIVLLVTMTRPILFKPFSWVLFGVSSVLERIVSRIILTGVFVVLVTPVGVVRRMLGHDPMALREWHGGQDSSFRDRKHTYAPADLEKQY